MISYGIIYESLENRIIYGLSMDYLWIIPYFFNPMEGQYEWRMGLSMGLFHLSMGLSMDYLWTVEKNGFVLKKTCFQIL
jgi:hypothetical protein